MRTLLIGAIGALLLSGCITNKAAMAPEIVTIQYDPNNYNQTRATASAVEQCRAKGYATAVPHSQQPMMSQSRWGYQNFACTM